MAFFLTHRVTKEGDKFLVRVLYDPTRHRNLNLLIKDFLEVTGMAISEDYCIKDANTDMIICSAELLVKGGIYRVSNADLN